MNATGDSPLRDAVTLARQGDSRQAQRLLQKLTLKEPQNVQAWLWLAHVAQTSEQQRAALSQAHLLQPDNVPIHESLQRLFAPQHIQRAARDGVFMGYARADELFAVDLVDNLGQHDISAWLDMADIGIDSTWHGSISRALHQSGLMLFILSPAALQSAELRAEMSLFLHTGKIILPVIHQTCDFEPLGLLCPPVDCRDHTSGLQHLLALLTDVQEAGNAP